jgi:ribosomal protein S12 methylthiotransferase accessory factor
VPVVTAVQLVPWANRDAYYAGGGADLDIESALVKALTEFTQSERVAKLTQIAPDRNFAESARQIFDLDADAPASKIDRFLQVIAYYGYRQNREKLRWYLEGGDEVLLSDLPRSPQTTVEAKLDTLLDVLSRRNIDPIAFDLTPPQLNHVKLMKVFVTELTQPFVQSRPYLGHPRFALAPVWTGRRDAPLRYEELNADPLPYP